MSIFFTAHVRRRMIERGIAERQVAETVSRPDRVLDSEKADIGILQKQFNGRTLEIIVRSIGRHKRVLTAYWL